MSAAFWRDRCATCAHYTETAAIGVGTGRCAISRIGTAESDGCAQHSSAPLQAAPPSIAELLFREFCRHHRCSGMAMPATAVRVALAAATDFAAAPAFVRARKLRDWAAIITATADALDPPHA